LPALEPFLAENVEKEARKDARLIARAAEALAAGRPPGAGDARSLLAAAREVDRQFLARVNAFPVRIDLDYASIEPLRLRRMELALETAGTVLEAWRGRRRLREAYGPGELERRLFEILRLYAEETQALSHGVRLPRLLGPLRERVAQRLRQAMLAAARTLARDAAVAVQKG
jgi:hypothetical protein